MEEGRNVHIGLDNACMTCNTRTGTHKVMKAFKMACLKYKSSDVDWKGEAH